MLAWFLLGALSGAGVAALLLQRRLGAERQQARQEAERTAELRIGELKEQYEQRLRDAGVSAAALRTQLEALLPQVADSVLGAKAAQFEQLASGDLRLLGEKTVSQVAASQQGLEAAVSGLGRQLADYQTRLQTFETERAQAQGRLDQQLTALLQTGAAMEKESRTLRETLATSGGVRGRWGEAVLKNILEASGLNEYVDYEVQVTVSTAQSNQRPDAVVHLPTGRDLIIDAKASLADFAAGLETADPGERAARFAQFAAGLRHKASELARRAYSDNLPGSLPYVVMFVPSEAAFRAAADADRELFEHGQGLRPPVLLASPSTLMPLVMLVREGWKQHTATQQTSELISEVQEFGRRVVSFLGHLQKLGEKLDGAAKSYNDAVGSYRQRLAPRWERLQKLGAGWEQTPELEALENRPLAIEAEARIPRARSAGGEE